MGLRHPQDTALQSGRGSCRSRTQGLSARSGSEDLAAPPAGFGMETQVQAEPLHERRVV